jgi:hypothetical protein
MSRNFGRSGKRPFRALLEHQVADKAHYINIYGCCVRISRRIAELLLLLTGDKEWIHDSVLPTFDDRSVFSMMLANISFVNPKARQAILSEITTEVPSLIHISEVRGDFPINGYTRYVTDADHQSSLYVRTDVKHHIEVDQHLDGFYVNVCKQLTGFLTYVLPKGWFSNRKLPLTDFAAGDLNTRSNSSLTPLLAGYTHNYLTKTEDKDRYKFAVTLLSTLLSGAESPPLGSPRQIYSQVIKD